MSVGKDFLNKTQKSQTIIKIQIYYIIIYNFYAKNHLKSKKESLSLQENTYKANNSKKINIKN